MANKRDFKKSVKEIGDSICGQLLFLQESNPKIDRETTYRSVAEILDAVDLAKARSNSFMGRRSEEMTDSQERSKNKKDFQRNLFSSIRKDFSESVDSALKTFNEALPAEVRESNKSLK